LVSTANVSSSNGAIGTSSTWVVSAWRRRIAISKRRDGSTLGFFQSHAGQFVWEYFRRKESRVSEQILSFVRTRFFEDHRGDHGGVDNPIGHRDLRESFSCCLRELEARADVLLPEVLQRSDGLAK
jgi:hypothetical protein